MPKASPTANQLMKTNFICLNELISVNEAIDKIRIHAQSTDVKLEAAYRAYTVNDQGEITGFIFIRDLILHDETNLIKELANHELITANPKTSASELLYLISHHNLALLPVVDDKKKVVGTITPQELDGVLTGADNKTLKLAGINPTDAHYLETPVRKLLFARMPWLMALFVVEMLSISVLEHQINIAEIAVLLTIVPLITSSGGNVGAQSATLIIRAMAVGEITPKRTLQVIYKEFSVAILLGLLLGLFGFARFFVEDILRDSRHTDFWFFLKHSQTLLISSTVALGVTAIVITGALLGATVPMILKRIGFDPAVSSAPVITSTIDVLGLYIFFSIGRALLI